MIRISSTTIRSSSTWTRSSSSRMTRHRSATTKSFVLLHSYTRRWHSFMHSRQKRLSLMSFAAHRSACRSLVVCLVRRECRQRMDVTLPHTKIHVTSLSWHTHNFITLRYLMKRDKCAWPKRRLHPICELSSETQQRSLSRGLLKTPLAYWPRRRDVTGPDSGTSSTAIQSTAQHSVWWIQHYLLYASTTLHHQVLRTWAPTCFVARTNWIMGCRSAHAQTDGTISYRYAKQINVKSWKGEHCWLT